MHPGGVKIEGRLHVCTCCRHVPCGVKARIATSSSRSSACTPRAPRGQDELLLGVVLRGQGAPKGRCRGFRRGFRHHIHPICAKSPGWGTLWVTRMDHLVQIAHFHQRSARRILRAVTVIVTSTHASARRGRPMVVHNPPILHLHATSSCPR